MRFPAPATHWSRLRAAGLPSPKRHVFDFGVMAAATFLRALYAGGPRPHVLVHARAVDVEPLMSAIAAWSPEPVHACDVPGPLYLPETPPTTLVIRDVACLSMRQQIRLADWMCRAETHVVSVSSVALPRLVEEGRFLEGLYDRLSALQVNAMFGSPAVGRAS